MSSKSNNINLSSTNKLLPFYYLATPLFALADFGLNANIRLAALDNHPVLKVAYYIVCFSAGYLALKKNVLASLFALIESSASILLLILSLFLPYLDLLNSIVSNDSTHTPLLSPFNKASMINFILSGAILITCFYKNPLFKFRAR